MKLLLLLLPLLLLLELLLFITFNDNANENVYMKTYKHPEVFIYRSYAMIFASADSHLTIAFDISNLTQCSYTPFSIFPV